MHRIAETAYRCDCTTAAHATCASTDDFHDRLDDGGCGCPCHGIYADDPEHWQPMFLWSGGITDAELRDTDDWLARMDAAEALIDEPDETGV